MLIKFWPNSSWIKFRPKSPFFSIKHCLALLLPSCLPNSSAFCPENTEVQHRKYAMCRNNVRPEQKSGQLVQSENKNGTSVMLPFPQFPPNWQRLAFLMRNFVGEVILVANLRGLNLELPIFYPVRHQQTWYHNNHNKLIEGHHLWNQRVI